MINFVQLDKGGVLYHTMVDVPSDGSRWDNSPAPTVTLKSSSGGTIRSSESATINDATTISAAAAAKATSITATDNASFTRFSRAIIGPNDAGQWEWITIDAPGSAGAVTLLDPLEYSYESGSAIKSHTMSTTVSSSDAGDLARHCRADWAYTVDSVARVESTEFVVSRYAPRIAITPADAIQHDPRLRKYVGSNQQVEILLKTLWESRVLPDVAKLFGAPGAVPSGETLKNALLAKMDAHLARRLGAYDAEVRYEEVYAELIDEIRTCMIDSDEDGSVEGEEIRTTRVVRVSRG